MPQKHAISVEDRQEMQTKSGAVHKKERGCI